MATIVAQATGNWSAGATWTGGVKPGAGDTAQCGAYTVTIDENVTCTKIEATSTGFFAVTAACTITADIDGGTADYNANAGVRCSHSSGTVAITGNVTGGSLLTALQVSGAGTVTIEGDVTGGSGSSVRGIFMVNNGPVTIDGDVTGGSAASAHGIYNEYRAPLTVTGTVTGGSSGDVVGIRNYENGTVIVKRAKGGTAVGAVGVYNRVTTGICKVKELEFGANGSAPTAGFVLLDVDQTTNRCIMKRSDTGADLTLDWDHPAVGDVEDGVFYALGTKEGTLEVSACDYPAEADVQSGVKFDGETKTGTFVAPAVADVQSGVTYGAAAEYTGTLTLPTVAQVESGVGYGAAGTEFTGELNTGLDWTADEKKQIRKALGITGTTAATTGTGTLEALFAALATDAEVADAIWDELRSGHTELGSFGKVSEWASSGSLDAAGVRTAVGLATANLDTQLGATATATELAKVPKSDGAVSWNVTALAAINAEVDTALNTAIPGSPIADSINERIVAIDGYGAPPSAATVADAVWDEVSTGHTSAGKAGEQLWTDLDAAYAIVNHTDYGNAKLVRSTTPANTLTVDASHRALSDLASILGTALTETAGQIAAAFKKFFDKSTPTGTINSLPDAVPGAAGGVFIAGSNVATSISSAAGSALTLTSSGSNGHGLLAQGHGTGSGITASGGGISGNGIYAVGDADGMGILAVGGDSALGLTAGIYVKSQSSGTPVGLYVEDGAIITDDAGTALLVSSTGGNGDGITIVGNGSGGDLVSDITGNVSGSVGSVSGDTKQTGDVATLITTVGVAGAGLTVLATATELAKVPKSDAAVSWNATALAAINAEVDAALNTAIPGSPTPGSFGKSLLDVLADTDELQTDWTNGGRLDLLLDAAGSAGDPWGTVLPGTYGAGTAGKALSDVLGDTNELQTDWTNGGRLDLLLDETAKTGVDGDTLKDLSDQLDGDEGMILP